MTYWGSLLGIKLKEHWNTITAGGHVEPEIVCGSVEPSREI